jgi:ABC-2 type transport system ATP-binding protein
VVGGLENVVKVEAGDLGGGLGQLLVFPVGHADILDPVCRALDAAGLGVNEVYVERGRLDEVFRQLTQAA